MPDGLYYCTQENNTCPKSELCKRYVNPEDQCHTTLFKAACNENNSFVLFLEYDSPEKEGEV